MMSGSNGLRKVLLAMLAGIAVLWAVLWLYGYLTTGRIVVKTDNQQNIVKIVTTADGSGKQITKQTQGSSTLRLKPGDYTVYVYAQGGTYGTSKSVSVKARQKVIVTLNPPRLADSQPIYGRPVSSVYATRDRLIYLDSDTGVLKQIDKAGNIVSLFPNLIFQGVRWSASGLGIAQTQDGKLYVLRGRSATRLRVPELAGETDFVSYDISPDGQIYISDAGSVYSVAAGTYKPTMIYYQGGTALQLFASDANVAAIQLGQRESANSLLVLSNKGKLVAKNEMDSTQLAWSPDGQSLVANKQDDYIVFTKDLRQRRIFSAQQSSAVTWLDNGSFLYNIAGQLWSYDVAANQSVQLTSLGAGNDINDIFISKDAEYAYFSTSSSTKGQLFRAGLKGQKSDVSLKALSSFLPESVGVCDLSYISFGKPVIFVTYPNLETTAELCDSAAKRELRYFGLNPDIFRFVTAIIPGS